VYSCGYCHSDKLKVLFYALLLTGKIAISIYFVGVFAQLPDLHNLFSESGAKTTHANKQHYQRAQFIPPLYF